MFTPPPARGSATAASDRFRHATSTQEAAPNLTDHSEVARRLRFNYAHAHRDAATKNLDTIQAILEHFEKRPVHIDALLKDAANLICKQFGISNATIGLRDPDGMFRYKVMVGLKPDTQAAQAKLVYTERQFGDQSEYKGTNISKFSKIYLEEDILANEMDREVYNRPVLLGAKRLTAEDSLEGDYIDIHIFGVSGELIGWIEISGTRTGKIPDAATIRLIEIMASVIGIALSTPDITRPRG